MRPVLLVARREFAALFATPLGAWALGAFLAAQGTLAFTLGGFFARDQADLAAFFAPLPWVLLPFTAAMTMRLWAGERGAGTIELLMALPVEPEQAVLGKFLAAWGFCGLALALCAPFVATVNLLGRPDNGAIACGFAGAALLAAALVAIGEAASALAGRSQAGAFLGALCTGGVLLGCATPMAAEALAPLPALSRLAGALSLLDRFDRLADGLMRLDDVAMLGSVAAGCLLVAGLALRWRPGL